MRWPAWIGLAMLLPAAAARGAERAPDSGRGVPVELGQVKWHRDYAAGLQESRTARKPILLLFNEVPG
jgi:hypothetical protein